MRDELKIIAGIYRIPDKEKGAIGAFFFWC
jgi:hypothetical protein